ncbi:SRPBCC family protein [Nocardia pseudobrasiliensis]|uniref:Polyketide cyclase/dehydrase/lipid transport protein n=1 Tax=Nocardia pseudobrasiliensis TaxID=45979 RepID=A0A370ICC5_9NOCA|nr:SRPBCC family protein [Nocardia pseudobrasiliensis]RDI68367.1 polyketide cyclase/dehydrase/lipid transport protein [Nocardia pseudobrasiliensis]
MVHIHHRGAADVPLGFAFAYASDLRNAPEWLFGITRIDVLGDIPVGVGAVYDGTMKLGPITLHSTVRIVEWEQNSYACAESIAGFETRSTWRLRAVEDGTTEVVVDIDYELPGGFAGKALGHALEPFVQIAAQRSEAALRAVLERRYADAA